MQVWWKVDLTRKSNIQGNTWFLWYSVQVLMYILNVCCRGCWIYGYSIFLFFTSTTHDLSLYVVNLINLSIMFICLLHSLVLISLSFSSVKSTHPSTYKQVCHWTIPFYQFYHDSWLSSTKALQLKNCNKDCR